MGRLFEFSLKSVLNAVYRVGHGFLGAGKIRVWSLQEENWSDVVEP
jgi:hypothetical protein